MVKRNHGCVLRERCNVTVGHLLACAVLCAWAGGAFEQRHFSGRSRTAALRGRAIFVWLSNYSADSISISVIEISLEGKMNVTARADWHTDLSLE
jgi:hypothetical protein